MALRAEEHHQDRQKHARHPRGPAPARLHVDDRLANHGAARHAADETGGNVGQALAYTFAGLVAGVSVNSSTMDAVIIDSSSPTTASVAE